MKSVFVREDAVFTAQHFYLTLNYEAVHREAFEIVAIRNWALVAVVMVRLPSPPPPSFPALLLLCWVTLPRLAELNLEVLQCFTSLGCKVWGASMQGVVPSAGTRVFSCAENLPAVIQYHGVSCNKYKSYMSGRMSLSYWSRLEHSKVSIYF